MTTDYPLLPEEAAAPPTVEFHVEEVHPAMPDAELMQRWLEGLVERENGTLHRLTFIFCSDQYLHQLNLQYLQHDTFTDIITFPYREAPEVEGDIFISIDRIRDNATRFDVSFDRELHRVMAHGVLHLCGYLDKTPEDKKRMTQKENDALSLLEQLKPA